MPKLYIITEKHDLARQGVTQSLQAASERMGIVCEPIIVDDLMLADIEHMQFEKGSLLYRTTTVTKATIVESMLVLLHPNIFTTIYAPKTLALPSRSYRELCEQIAAGLRGIPTLIVDETWKLLDTAALSAKVETLGGFPVIIKELGLSHGQGVRKAESAEELAASLSKLTNERYGTILRKYLADYRHFRLIVVDGAVVAAIEYHKPADDFRTNASEAPLVSPLAIEEIPADLTQLALRGVALRSSILGGVDILVDQSDGIGYLAEVNVPCYYVRAEKPTGIDISSLLIEALLRKSQNQLV